MKQLRFVLVAASLAALAICGSTTSGRSSSANTVIFASAQNITVGGYRIFSPRSLLSPSYAGAIKAYGLDDGCNLLSYERGGEPQDSLGQVTWRSLGVRIRVATLGALPDGADVCTDPKDAKLDKEWVTGRQWRTAKGLRIGDPITKLRRLYPKASRHGNSWWMVTARSIVVGPGLYPIFYVQAKGGRVDQFVFNIGAQGE